MKRAVKAMRRRQRQLGQKQQVKLQHYVKFSHLFVTKYLAIKIFAVQDFI